MEKVIKSVRDMCVFMAEHLALAFVCMCVCAPAVLGGSRTLVIKT